MTKKSDEDLLAELDESVDAKAEAEFTAEQERLIVGFEDIQQFVEKNNRLPDFGGDKNIFERIYATRLEAIRKHEQRTDLHAHDHQQLLAENSRKGKEKDSATMLAELGIEVEASTQDDDITQLRHVRSPEEIRAAEEIATRTKCNDFHLFKPIFATVQAELKSGLRAIRKFQDDASVAEGDFFILYGQVLYVAEKGTIFTSDYGRQDSRLRVIYDNATESDILMRSLTRALNKDENGRRITALGAGPLFTKKAVDGDKSAGMVYICQSLSSNPYVAENRDLLHKIGITSTSIETRLANAENDPSFLMAPVKVVATYELFNINRAKLETLLHRFFYDARLKVEILDRFGKPITPREWFLVPLNVIEQAVGMVSDESLVDYQYDVNKAAIVKIEPA